MCAERDRKLEYPDVQSLPVAVTKSIDELQGAVERISTSFALHAYQRGYFTACEQVMAVILGSDEPMEALQKTSDFLIHRMNLIIEQAQGQLDKIKEKERNG